MTNREMIECGVSLIGGAGIGAALMYLLDPEVGYRRRQSIASTASEYASSAADTAASTAGHARDAVASAFSKVADHLASTADDATDSARSAARGGISSVRSTGRRAIRAARNYIPRLHFGDGSGPGYTGTALTGLGCLALGAAVMYFFDPTRGAQRRGRIAGRASRAADTVRTAASDAYGSAREAASDAADYVREQTVGRYQNRQGTESAATANPGLAPSVQGGYTGGTSDFRPQ
ncbi:MAG TPA: hypothetical protein VIL86_06845 [Tepidisphaeraceae bacterium]|jgi:gas vesicle protein